MRKIKSCLLVALAALLLVNAPAAQAQGRRGGGGAPRGVYKSAVAPNWFANNAKFWYRNDLSGGEKEFIVVDAQAGTRQPAFDHAKLAGALSGAANASYRGQSLPFNTIEIADDGKSVRFTVSDVTWKANLDSYEVTKSDGSPVVAPSDNQPTVQTAGRGGRGAGGARGGGRGGGGGPSRSPDGKWSASIRDFNIFLRAEADGKETQLTQDGSATIPYGRISWSPDSSSLVAFRTEPGERKEVYRIESSPRGGGRALLQTAAYALPGDKYNSMELSVFDVATAKQIKPSLDRIDFNGTGGNPNPNLRWAKDGYHFSFEKVDRGHQRFRVIEVNARTGESRSIIDEKTNTFIWTAHTESLGVTYVNWMQKTDEIIYVSERDGWRHMYLIDVTNGAIKNQITKGEYVLRGIERIDEDNRQVWFRASGKNSDQDPYLVHYYRVNFDGTGLVALTEGNGSHSVAYSPDRKYLIDTYSRVDMPPINELRRVSDGKLVAKLEESDITEAKNSGWEAPEVFVAKGRDGKTDIWGIINRPRNFDPSKKYPVIEQIYNGPQSAYVPKTFSAQRRFANLTDLGFIVVQMDAMGTAFRSKAFHDVCWHNLGDAGFPDRIAWHKAAAAKYSYYDLGRVGIYGTSAGGQNAAGAVIFHPEFYKAAVANCGCHDNRMDKASWNEQWMGYPVGEHYSASSNIDNAAKLGGHLQLVVGELDNNVPPESTYRLADALIKANKDFELITIPGAGHGAQSPITQRKLQDFFMLHLQGVQPPNRNAQTIRR